MKHHFLLFFIFFSALPIYSMKPIEIRKTQKNKILAYSIDNEPHYEQKTTADLDKKDLISFLKDYRDDTEKHPIPINKDAVNNTIQTIRSTNLTYAGKVALVREFNALPGIRSNNY